MKIRILLVALSSVLTTVLVSAPGAVAASPGCGCAPGLPAGVPALVLLEPESSTRVAAGGQVTVAASFVEVPVQPTAELFYRGPRGVSVSVPFDTETFTITVPADWRPGRYRLMAVETTAFGTGTQYRDGRIVGTPRGDPAVTLCGRSDLDLRVLDLTVTG
jgi:hypothetical protein